MTSPPLHTLGIHANQMSRNCGNERMQTIMQWVGVGSVIMMGVAASVGLLKDIIKTAKPEHRELRERLDRHYRDRDEDRGRER
jgi:hypothetical protein